MPCVAGKVHFGIGIGNDYVNTDTEFWLTAPIDGGPSWVAYGRKDYDSSYTPSMTFDFGYSYTGALKVWAKTSLEFSFSLTDSGSSRFAPATDGHEGAKWKLGKYASLLVSHKVGNEYLDWIVAGKKISPYFCVSVGRLRTDFSVTPVPVLKKLPTAVMGKTGKVGLGVLLGDTSEKTSWDIGLFWQFYSVSHTSKFPNLPNINSLLYDFYVEQWKMQASYSFSF